MTQTDAGTGEQVKDKATEVAGQAQEKAQQAAGQAREQVRSQIDQRSTDAGRKVSAQGSDLRAGDCHEAASEASGTATGSSASVSLATARRASSQ